MVVGVLTGAGAGEGGVGPNTTCAHVDWGGRLAPGDQVVEGVVFLQYIQYRPVQVLQYASRYDVIIK